MKGTHFIAYDDGDKPEHIKNNGYGTPRRQMGAFVFARSTSRKLPMSVRVLLPAPGCDPPGSKDGCEASLRLRGLPVAKQDPSGQMLAAKGELLEALQALPAEEETPYDGTQLLKVRRVCGRTHPWDGVRP